MSILANIQKQSSYSGIEMLINTATMLANMQGATGQPPEILDKIDCDEIIDQIADMYTIPAGIVLGDDVVEEKRNARREAEVQAQQQQEMLAGAQGMAQAVPKVTGAMKDLSEMQMPGGGTGLDAMAGLADFGG